MSTKNAIILLFIVFLTYLAFLRFQEIHSKKPEEVFASKQIVVPDGMKDTYEKIFKDVKSKYEKKTKDDIKNIKEAKFQEVIENKIKDFYFDSDLHLILSIYLYNSTDIDMNTDVTIRCTSYNELNKPIDKFFWDGTLKLISKKASLLTDIDMGKAISKESVKLLKCHAI